MSLALLGNEPLGCLLRTGKDLILTPSGPSSTESVSILFSIGAIIAPFVECLACLYHNAK